MERNRRYKVKINEESGQAIINVDDVTEDNGYKSVTIHIISSNEHGEWTGATIMLKGEQIELLIKYLQSVGKRELTRLL